MNFKKDSILIEDGVCFLSLLPTSQHMSAPSFLRRGDSGGYWTVEPSWLFPWVLMPLVKVWMLAMFSLANETEISREFLPLILTTQRNGTEGFETIPNWRPP